MSPRDWVLISETFLTHQGEGPSCGQLAFFVRFGGCNLGCKWCDAAYSVFYDERKARMHESGHAYDPRLELRRMTVTALAKQVRVHRAKLIVITGGEPLIQLEALSLLISAINEELPMRRFEIETAGTVYPGLLSDFENVSYNVSPKLASSGNSISDRYHPGVLQELLCLDSRFKFVVDTRVLEETIAEDLEEITEIVKTVGIPDERVWLMPCGTTEAEVVHGLRILAPIALDRGWNLSGREHILIYRNERGH